MTDKTSRTQDNRLPYRSPQVKVLFVRVQRVLCQSNNEPMREYDYGDGGFNKEY